MKTERPSINYLFLFVVIMGGVTIGNLASNWITAIYVEFEIARATSAATKAANVAVQKAREEAAEATLLRKQQIEARRRQQEAEAARVVEMRKADPTGKKLGAICEDWQRADLDFGSYTTGVEVHKHCGRYERYINTGVLSR